MTGIDEAQELLKRTQAEADRLVAVARLELGRAIHEAREAGVPQKDIAAHLKLTREQVRRLAVAWREANPSPTSAERLLAVLFGPRDQQLPDA